MPPGIRGRHAAGRPFGISQPRGHVGLPVQVLMMEAAIIRTFRVPENIVVFGRPFALGPSTMIISPDDLIEKTGHIHCSMMPQYEDDSLK